MANIRSAEKQRRQAAKARVRNRTGKSRLKSALKEARSGATNLSKAFSEIDKAARKGLIKDNTANRYKSRLSAAAKRAEAK